MVEVSVAEIDPIAVLRLNETSGCTTYDVEYVWLATELDLPLVTSDQQVIRAFPEVAVDPQHFA